MRRLLRVLDDPAAVSRNSLVARLFASPHDRNAHQRVRAAVLASVELLAPRNGAHADVAMHQARQYQIITRYDLGNASMDELLHALCIERSQFYRERVGALERLADWVERYVDDASSARVDVPQQPPVRRSDPVERARYLLRMAEMQLGSDRNEARARAEEAVRLLDSAAS